MFKKILILVLVAAMLSLASCKVVDVIDHGDPKETTEPQKEYTPWGCWYSAETLGAIEFIEGSNVAKLYLLTAGYYEYNTVEEVVYSYDGDATFSVTYDDETLIFTFNKYANTLMSTNVIYTHANYAPTKHPVYSYPDYPNMDVDTYISVGDIDYSSLVIPVLDGTRFEIAKAFYGDQDKIPSIEGIERAAEHGDYVNIDYCGYLDGVPFDGGKAESVRLLISDYQNRFIPGFTDGIIGHTVGETFDVNVTFPENYHAADLAGKAVVFTMTLNSIYDLSLTDEKVAEYKGNEFQTYNTWFEDMKPDVVNSLFFNALLTATTPKDASIPQETYLYYYQQEIDQLRALAYSENINYELLLYYFQTSEAAIFQEAVNTAVYNMGIYLLAQKNELSWSQEEFDTEYERFVDEYLKKNENATREEACKNADQYAAQIKDALTREKVLNWVFEQIFPTSQQ
jgi:trigger factor